MSNGIGTRSNASALRLVVDAGPLTQDTLHSPPAPAHLALRRAAEMVEGVAFEMAGREPATLISRLIEIAAELERLARGRGTESGGTRVPAGLD